ncbi:MAG: tripartite tricarboxylate transporter substrate binding protein [Candidatus Tectomicrobia bacterium]|uniref:Tripartite tricarboxylate transporter substrate binding protein n=1 Tax=Tectimicrobiota bacterium TaxID=2528274 RepID=A0A932HYR4_UNCTE|nr:tripartite tricarboxylate transporter substrate binding protein [Candidatus Tectomicrobia bacterium]
MKKFALALLAFAAFGLWAFPAAAAYPERPIKLIVPWPAGGDTDGIFRPFGPQLQKYLGQTVVVANVGGASGTKGAREAKGSPPDGYTLYAIHDYIHLTYYTGVANVKFSDFAPICSLSSTPAILTASPKTPWKTWQEFLADAKKRPGQISAAVTLGSTSHIFPALVEKAAGIKLKYVSYEGLAPRMNALLGGHVDLGESNLTQKGKVQAGQLKFLAIATEKRHPEIPNVPTFKDMGLDIVYDVTRGLVVPKGTPEAIQAKLEDACKKAAAEPKFADDMAKQGTEVRFRDRKGYAAYLKRTDDLSLSKVKELGLFKAPKN